MNVTTTRARARKNDPQESHAAAAAVAPATMGRVKRNIIRLLALRPMHDEALVSAYTKRKLYPATTDSSIRSRRAELVRAGAVQATGRRVVTESGRWSQSWELNLDNPLVQAVVASSEGDR